MKNPAVAAHGKIFFHDIGDYLSREEKLEKIVAFKSIAGIETVGAWETIIPDAHGDWLGQRDDSLCNFIAMGDKKSTGIKLFDIFSMGVVTARDAWCYNASKKDLASNMRHMIEFYNKEVDRFSAVYPGLDKKEREKHLEEFLGTDPKKISWSRFLKQEWTKGRHNQFKDSCIVPSLYRPFSKQWMYFNRTFNEMVYKIPSLFPDSDATNVVIGISAPSERAKFSVLIMNIVPSLHAADMVGSQYFPLYLYEEPTKTAHPTPSTALVQGSLLASPPEHPSAPAKRQRRDAISDEGLAHFQEHYPGETLTKDDLFYYVYGLLHSPGYRELYADNLTKELPRIPCVKTAEDFWAFSKAGRDLAALHLDYETVEPYPLTVNRKPWGEDTGLTDADYCVEKMRYGKNGKGKDLTTLVYNPKITLTGIPLEAYKYVVNGKPALDWVVERQRVKTDIASGIVNDANAWATETMHNPRYPLELFARVVTVSLETVKIVDGLPPLNI